MEKFKRFIDLKKEIASYDTMLKLEFYDSRTIAPKKSLDLTNELSAFLSSKLFKLTNNKQLEDLIKDLILESSLDEEIKLELKLELANIDKNKCIPSSEYLKGIECFKKAEIIWEQAREANDYNLFKDILKEVVSFRKKWISYRNINKNYYEQLLDDYQKDASISMYDEFFDLIKKELIPLIKEVAKRNEMINDDFLFKKIDINTQKKVVKIIADYLGFDSDFGYISESTHPFSLFINKDNIRITTKYMEDNICSTIFSVIHEIGHGLYSQNVDYKFIGSIKESLISMGMHESQSRFMENCIGKSYEFWEYLYPKIQKEVKEFSDISLEQFYKAINKSYPSLIRTEADELTYPIHILIRYEIEKEIFNGNVNFDDLNKIWNEKYSHYLGIEVKDDASGILQDIHWCSDFGYFPTYALGSAIAAQINDFLVNNLKMLELLKKGKVKEINKWLNQNIHQYGGLYNYDEILLKSTNEKFNPKYYVEYLKNKFKNIYNI